MSVLTDFVTTCEQVFQDNLLCILLVGSAQRDETTPFSDIDVIVIIQTMNVDQVARLRSVIRSSAGLLDCSILCQDELPVDPNLFYLGSHGCYQLELVLKRAKCVFGQNVLLEIPSPTERDIRLSIARKVIEYTWWTRRMFVESNRKRTLEMNYKLNSRLVKMIRDILYLRGIRGSIIDPVGSIVDIFLREYIELFTEVETQVIANLGDTGRVNVDTSNMSDEYFLVRYSVVNKIHKEMARMVLVSTDG